MSLLTATAKYAGWVSLFTSTLFVHTPVPQRALLDPRQLSEHLKRDMGFLDGINSRGRRN